MRNHWLSWMVPIVLAFGTAQQAVAQEFVDQRIDQNIRGWIGTYKHLHKNPELSTQEKETSALLAGDLKKLGYQVTDHFGQYENPNDVAYGIVAVLKNGPGPTVYVRTEMDALPVIENTGLLYASKVRVKRGEGEVGVMHACGHDLHMTVFLGTAKVLSEERARWSGTLVLIGQPAEESTGGAAAMLARDYTRDFQNRITFSLCTTSRCCLRAKWPGVKDHLAGSDSVDITIRGHGGHGGTPQMTKDPIVVACELVVFLQTVVSRETDPLEPAVVTVGSFHAGTKHNIIPDDAHLQLTVRTMKPAQREKTLAAIRRATNGIAAAAGIPAERAPIIEISKDNVPATINNPALTRRVAAAMEKGAGQGKRRAGSGDHGE